MPCITGRTHGLPICISFLNSIDHMENFLKIKLGQANIEIMLRVHFKILD